MPRFDSLPDDYRNQAISDDYSLDTKVDLLLTSAA